MTSVTRAERALLGAATVLALAVLVIGIGGTDFWPPDEPRVAEIARQMANAGDWLVPRFNGQPFLEEPPLFYWLQAATYRIAGKPSTIAARVPSAAAGVAGVLATAVLARGLGANGLVAALVLATAPEYWWMARSATPDMAAAAAITVALGAFFLAWRTGRRLALVATALALAFAFWCKSLLPVGLAVLTAAAFLTRAGRRRLSAAGLAAAAAGSAALGLVWVGLIGRDVGAGGARFFLLTNHLGRLAGAASEGHVRPAWYYAPNLALDLFPWALLLPVAAIAAWRERRTPERLFPLLWAACMLAVLTASASKRAHYLLPAYPAFAVLVAQWWPDAWRGRADRAARRVVVLTAVLAGPALALLAMSLRPDRLPMEGQGGRTSGVVIAALVRESTPPAAAWTAAAVLLLLGVAILRTDRRRRMLAVVGLLGVELAAVEGVLTLAVLPRLNALSTARPIGQRLARLADDGVPVMTFGADDDHDLALSGVLFYAGRPLPGGHDPAKLAAALAARGGCAVMRRQDYPALADVLPATPVPEGTLATSRLLVIERPPGICSGTSPARARVR